MTQSVLMRDQAEAHTVRIHRVFKAPVERVFRAFVDPDAMAKWSAPYGFICKVHHMEARVGGTYRMSFTNFGSGRSHAFGGKFVAIVPNERLKYTDSFEDPGMPGEIQVEVTFRTVACGTEVRIVQSNLPEALPVEFCYVGWQESIEQLAKLVEPEIPDAV